jgi:hypothetical protein
MAYHRNTLIAELRERGVTYLSPGDAVATEPLASDGDLIIALLEQPDSRLHLALVPLFIRRPDLAQIVPGLVSQLSAESALTLQTLYMAAVYLQRLWRTRLSYYLPDLTLLPDLYAGHLNLPPANERFGKAGLHALAEAWTARSPYPFNRLASLNRVIDLFFEQLKLEASTDEHAPGR